MANNLRFKVADKAMEFEAIHRLNYSTFVEEIPQHPPNDSQRLVDRFHAENTYVVCLDGDKLVGMVAGRCQRPFSLDAKVPDLDSHLPAHHKAVEVRLLAVAASHRKQTVLAQLVGTLARHFREQGCDLAVISGTVRELRLYRHLGFQPFGNLVGSEQARYQPMCMTLQDYAAHAAHLEAIDDRAVTNLMPGPVALSAAVSAAFAQPPLSHRSTEFERLIEQVRVHLRRLCSAADVVLMPGTGTLANDAIAAQLAALGQPGLVLSNGEFGDRLLDHARRWRLDHGVLRADWGQGFDTTELRAAFARTQPRWLWMVACETSTGVRNPLDEARALCLASGARLCVDAVSAVGLQDINLQGAHLVSLVSGKALGAYPGLAIVAHDNRLAPAGQLPRYLDLAAYRQAGGVPYTQSSNLMAALHAALARDWPLRWQQVASADRRLRDRLKQLGLTVVADDTVAMPGVISLALPPQVSSQLLARRLQRSGYQLASRSEYLVRRNWLQICLMGQWAPAALEILPDVLAGHLKDGQALPMQAAAAATADHSGI